MNSVDKFVRNNILTFPLIFPNRTAVLHHTLCVIGNGFEWSDSGEVVEDVPSTTPLWNKEKELAELDADLKARFKDERIREIIGEGMRKMIDADAQTVDEVDTRVHLRAPVENFYPQCVEYALLMNIPENVTPEWQEACDEMKQLAEKAGWKF
jgi:hypothetical protein